MYILFTLQEPTDVLDEKIILLREQILSQILSTFFY